MFHAVIIYK
ncbi:unnamed protein product, partial [Allacma fusca]